MENVRYEVHVDSHFGESLVENARFGRLHSQFLRRSRGKRSFWKCGFSLLAKSLVEKVR